MAISTCRLQGCTRPCFQRDGIIHDYCGRSHAKLVLGDSLRRPHGSCHRCRLHGCSKEVFFDEETETVHDFCCRRHANLAINRGQWPLWDSEGDSQCELPGCDNYVYRDPDTGEESEYCSRSHVAQGRALECVYPSCRRFAWVDPVTQASLGYCGSRCASGVGAGHLVGQTECSLPGCVLSTLLHPQTLEDLGYCSDDHRSRAEQRQLGPNTEPHVDRTFRGGPGQNDFQLKVLTNRHASYPSLKEQFFTKWMKPWEGLTIERIFKVQVPTAVYERHKEYSEQVHNTRRRFHGTSCSSACSFFVNLRGGPCGERSCSVCNICTEGFKLRGYLGRTAQMTNFSLRFGEGLYFSSVSGKANDYASNSQKLGPQGRRWRCMFMANVVIGRSFITQKGELPSDMCPPPGYHSVVGEVGSALNYDEVCVYDEEAALPSYLIVYSMN